MREKREEKKQRQNQEDIVMPPLAKNVLPQVAGSQLLSKVTNAKLAEHLIGMSSVIMMPESYWPEDGCQCSVTMVEHRPSKRHNGGHAFSMMLAESTPAYTGGAATDIPYVAELSSKQIKNGIEQHYGKNKTLRQMFDPKWQNAPTGMAHAALDFKNQLIRNDGQNTLKIDSIVTGQSQTRRISSY